MQKYVIWFFIKLYANKRAFILFIAATLLLLHSLISLFGKTDINQQIAQDKILIKENLSIQYMKEDINRAWQYRYYHLLIIFVLFCIRILIKNNIIQITPFNLVISFFFLSGFFIRSRIKRLHRRRAFYKKHKKDEQQ